jgi:separase
MLPWENLPVLRNQEIYRMPSMGNIFLALTGVNNHYKDSSVTPPPFPAIDPINTFYLLNPSDDLSSTQEEFEQMFRMYKWKVNKFPYLSSSLFEQHFSFLFLTEVNPAYVI